MAAPAELIARRRLAMQVARLVQFVRRSLTSSVPKGPQRPLSTSSWNWRPVAGRRESPSFVDGRATKSVARCTSFTPTTLSIRSSQTFTVEVRPICLPVLCWNFLSRAVFCVFHVFPQSPLLLDLFTSLILWLLFLPLYSAMRRACQPNDEDV